MTHEQIEAIRERAEKATEGPWNWDGDFTYTKRGMLEPLIWESEYKGIGVEETDADFIAHSREDIPALLAEVERLQKQNEEYERALSQIAHGDTHVAYPHDIAAWALGWELNGKTIKEESE